MSELKLIDLQAKFTEFYMDWNVKNQEKLKDKNIDLDEFYYSMYDRWLDMKADYLDNKSPRQYFKDIKDVQYLVSMYIEYIINEIEVPDVLTDCIIEKKDETYPVLINMVMKDADALKEITPDQLEDIRSEIIPVIGRMGKPAPYIRYIQILAGIENESALADELAEAIRDEAETYRDEILKVYDDSKGYARKTLLELLSLNAPDERITEILRRELNGSFFPMEYVVNLISGYFDETLVEDLKPLLRKKDLTYLQFKEIQNALMELTGEEIEEQDFTGDSVYDYMVEHDEL